MPVFGLICGIFCSELRMNPGDVIFIGVLSVLILANLVFWLYKKSFSILFVFIIFSVLGFVLSGFYNRKPPLPEALTNSELTVVLKVDEIFRSAEKFRKYKVSLISANSVETAEIQMLLYWDKSNPELYPGEQIRIRSRILPLQKPLNPYQFDYSKYLKRKGIVYTVFHKGDFERVRPPSGFRYRTARFKKKIHSEMIAAGYSKAASDLVGAMLLGDRTEMDPDIEEDFRRTGVVHLLAISGLHVMMVFSIIMILLYPLARLKNGKNFRIWVSLILIWVFVAFVDFRPPVFRSGLMISIYYITVLLKRKPNIYHTLLLSALILLLYNPNFVFDPGFLLSYSAVFFIVYFNPVYRKLFKPKSGIMKTAVDCTGTTVSAQLGTLPFSVFFFHQTSGLFLAGNVVMIAASYLMVAGGMLTVALTAFGIDFVLWQFLYDGFIGLCYSYVRWLSGFDALVFDRLSLTSVELILLIIGILMVRLLFLSPKPGYLFSFLSLIFVFESQRLYSLNRMMNREEIIVFHQNRNTVLGVRKGTDMDVFIADLTDTAKIRKYTIRPYSIGQKLKKVRLFDLNSTAEGFYKKTEDMISIGAKRLVIWEPGSLPDLKPNDFVLIRQNAEITEPEIEVTLITDGSSYPNFFQRIDYPKIWNTRRDGALVID